MDQNKHENTAGFKCKPAHLHRNWSWLLSWHSISATLTQALTVQNLNCLVMCRAFFIETLAWQFQWLFRRRVNVNASHIKDSEKTDAIVEQARVLFLEGSCVTRSQWISLDILCVLTFFETVDLKQQWSGNRREYFRSTRKNRRNVGKLKQFRMLAGCV